MILQFCLTYYVISRNFLAALLSFRSFSLITVYPTNTSNLLEIW